MKSIISAVSAFAVAVFIFASCGSGNNESKSNGNDSTITENESKTSPTDTVINYSGNNEMTGENWTATYKGTFTNSADVFSENFSGKGKYQVSNGNFIDGEWINGKFTGKINFMVPMEGIDATVTDGKNAVGDIDGSPYYTYNGTFIIKDISQDGIESELTGKGKYSNLMDGTVEEGEFVNGKLKK
ncbi:MAG: hypothetical protein AB7V36_01090 [Bacteroidales bacterium]